MHSLVIIDMQPGFSGACTTSLRQPILREIELCKKHKWPIIIVEFCRGAKFNFSFGATMPYIRNALIGHHRYRYVYKTQNDGSTKVRDALKLFTKCKKVRVVGVNTCACVRETALGLQKKNYKVSIIMDGCNCSDDCSPNFLIYCFNQEGLNTLRTRLV